MANSILSSDYRETIYVKDGKDRWTVKDGVWLLTDLGGFNGGDSSATDREFLIAGHVAAGSVGIDMGMGDKIGGSTSVWVTTTGTVHGYLAIALKGGMNFVSNLGEIGGKAGGVFLAGLDNHVINEGSVVASQGAAIGSTGNGFGLVNTGLISGTKGVESLGDDARIDNAGHILGTGSNISDAAVWLDGETSLLTNSGTISASASLAIRGDTGRETIDNTGDIIGTILLGDDDDTLNNNGGSITGKIDLGAGNDIFKSLNGNIVGSVYGGEGDDLYFMEGGRFTVVEFANGGNDTIRTDQSWRLDSSIENLTLLGASDINASGNSLGNVLTGNGGANRLNGKGGDDFIVGGEGADRLIGGAGIDTVSYSNSDAAVGVNLSKVAGSNVGGDAEGDSLAGFENVIGSAFGDNLTGSVRSSVLDGGRGSDFLDGRGFHDTFIYALDQFGAENDDVINFSNSAKGQKIVIRGGEAFDTFAELKASMVTQSILHTVIHFTATDSLTIMYTEIKELSAENFLFA